MDTADLGDKVVMATQLLMRFPRGCGGNKSVPSGPWQPPEAGVPLCRAALHSTPHHRLLVWTCSNNRVNTPPVSLSVFLYLIFSVLLHICVLAFQMNLVVLSCAVPVFISRPTFSPLIRFSFTLSHTHTHTHTHTNTHSLVMMPRGPVGVAWWGSRPCVSKMFLAAGLNLRLRKHTHKRRSGLSRL